MRQLHLFFNAWVFYTRFPAPSWVEHSSDNLNRASRFFPLIGGLLALLFYGCFSLANLFLSTELSVLVAIIIGILATGAFHEDGFADLCDGFGGGWKTEDVLRIMKDSRLGTYGVIGLWSILTLKWALIVQIITVDPSLLLAALLCAFTLSRAWSISLIALLPYVQQDKQSKAKPIAQQMHPFDLNLLWVFALLPLLLLDWTQALTLLAVGFVTMLYIRRWFRRRLDGYTGDALGASQQIQELICYLALLVHHAV